MNKKEAIAATGILDACIDTVASPEALLALNFLRRTLLDGWQRDICQGTDGQALLEALKPLPTLCGEMAALPMGLCQILYVLCAPKLEPGREPARQCREQAWKIRRLRQWTRELSALLVPYDAQSRQEALALQAGRLEMMADVFSHFLVLYRGSIAEAVSKRRRARQQVIQRSWEAIPLREVSDAAIVSRARLEGAKEKLSEFAAEISAAEVLIPMTEDSPTRTRATGGQESPPRETEEDA